MREPNDLDNGVTARGENQNHCIAVTLITAKARVTPTKTESVSRLELAACVIGTRLGLTVANALDLDKSTITFWTDSTNCLYWINSPSSNLKTFVSNRVGEVHTHSNPIWHYVWLKKQLFAKFGLLSLRSFFTKKGHFCDQIIRFFHQVFHQNFDRLFKLYKCLVQVILRRSIEAVAPPSPQLRTVLGTRVGVIGVLVFSCLESGIGRTIHE